MLMDHNNKKYSREIVNCVYMYMNCSNYFGYFCPYTIWSHSLADRLFVLGLTSGMAQFSLNNVHKRGLRHHHFISNIWLEMTRLNIQGRPGNLSISDIPSVEHRRHEMGFQTTLFCWYPLKSHNINIHQEIIGFDHYGWSGYAQFLMFRLNNEVSIHQAFHIYGLYNYIIVEWLPLYEEVLTIPCMHTQVYWYLCGRLVCCNTL